MPKTKSTSAGLNFSKDEFGKDVLLKDHLQVMMEWEKPYMEACIETLKPTGDVLEIGFGLGYSATAIQKFHPKSHTIIECDANVLKKAKAWAKQYPNVTILEGTWQEILPTLGKFDSVFFDDYSPFSQEEIEQLKKDTENYQKLTNETDSLRDSITQLLQNFRNIKFSDEDLTKFTGHLKAKPNVNNQQVREFIENLEKQGNITKKQADSFLKTLPKESAAKKSTVDSPETIEWVNKKKLGDRFITFVEQCLDKHMRPKAHLSAYMDSPETKAKNVEFQKRILSRSDINYEEKTIAVKTAPNCTYFQGDKALVMLVIKK